MLQSRSRGDVATIVLPIATAAMAIAIFVVDTVTKIEISVAVLYVVVVLIAARFCRGRALMMVAAGCVGLTAVSHILTPGGSIVEAFTNTLISLAAIVLTALLALQSQKATAVLQEQAGLLDQAHDSIFVRNLNDAITYWNRGAQELYGWRADQAIGKISHELLRTNFGVPLDKLRAELLRTGHWEGELKHIRADGTEVLVASRWSLHRDDREQPVAILETNNDITERKNREEEIRRLSQELEVSRLHQELAERAAEIDATNKELESFAYSVSHDLRAPLRHVVGFSELLQKQASTSLDDKSRGYVQTIIDSAKRMGNLIDDLLAFSRIGRADTKKTLISLEQLVKEVVAELEQETMGRDIVWKINALPVCYGDRSMLRQVIVNLVANAVKFTRMRNAAQIEIGCVDGNKNEVELFVRDNGAGFDMRYVNKLFGVFQRLHRSEEFEGTGIGLATVQRIIHRHGGEVRAEGVIGQGATVYFSLPKSKGAAERTGSTQ